MARNCEYKTRSGIKILCRSKTADINEVVVIMSGLEYPPKYLKIPENGIAIDIGAGIGDSTIYIDSLNRSRNFSGFAFEPFTDNFQLLKKNCQNNNVGQFELINAAVSDHSGKVKIDTNREVDKVAICNNKGTAVPSHKLSLFCQSRSIKEIDLLKMDVEGAEYQILESDYSFFRRAVKTFLLEYHYISDTLNGNWVYEKVRNDFIIEYIHKDLHSGVIWAKNKNLSDNSK